MNRDVSLFERFCRLRFPELKFIQRKFDVMLLKAVSQWGFYFCFIFNGLMACYLLSSFVANISVILTLLSVNEARSN
jgi:hypothetical protein